MPRKYRKTKPLIFVFCEGESEQAYTEFLKRRFQDAAVIKYPKKTGVFEYAWSCFDHNPKYRNAADVTDEIWLFFDVEVFDRDKWDKRQQIIRKLRKLRRHSQLRVRLLMTSGCIEYWLMLHFRMYTPPLQTTEEKEQVISDLVGMEPTYHKGNYTVTEHIAQNYPVACRNAEKIFRNLTSSGLPTLEDTDERNQWLCQKCLTFSNVFEAVYFLEGLQ